MPTKEQLETAIRIRAIIARFGPHADYEKCKEACEDDGLELGRTEWYAARTKIKNDTGWGGDNLKPEPVVNGNGEHDEGPPLPEKVVVKSKPTTGAKDSRQAIHKAHEFINLALKELMPVVIGDLGNDDEKKADEDYKDAKRAVKDLLHIKEYLE